MSQHDGYWYFGVNSKLQHVGHRFEEPQVSLKSEKDLSEDDLSLLDILYQERVNTGQIARIMSKRNGEDFGTLLPSTIYSITAKSKKMANLAKGITPKMSDAEKTLAQLRASNISHLVVYHDVSTGLLSYHRKGRKSAEDKFLELHCPWMVQEEINDIRTDLTLTDKDSLLLLVSMATDEMVRLVQMFPEVWFMDCTAGTNRQRMDLFKMAIRTPEGKTFPGNLTVIPSGRRWVFHCIYKVSSFFA